MRMHDRKGSKLCGKVRYGRKQARHGLGLGLEGCFAWPLLLYINKKFVFNLIWFCFTLQRRIPVPGCEGIQLRATSFSTQISRTDKHLPAIFCMMELKIDHRCTHLFCKLTTLSLLNNNINYILSFNLTS